MPPRVRRRNQRLRPETHSPATPIDRNAWLAAAIGVVAIVALAAAASLAQATEAVFVAASLLFSLCEGVVLAIVGCTWWSRRGIRGAIVAAAATAAVAAPIRWEVTILTHYGQTVPQQADLASDLLVSIAWGAFAGLAGATVLRPKLDALRRDAQARFTIRPPR
jgi:Na+/proline symporter